MPRSQLRAVQLIMLHEICAQLIGVWLKQITEAVKHPVLSHRALMAFVAYSVTSKSKKIGMCGMKTSKFGVFAHLSASHVNLKKSDVNQYTLGNNRLFLDASTDLRKDAFTSNQALRRLATGFNLHQSRWWR